MKEQKSYLSDFVYGVVKQQGLVVVLMLVIFSSIFIDRFTMQINIFNVMRQGSLTFLFASAMTVAMLAGGLDLSVGSVGAFAGAVTASFLVQGAGPFAILIGLLVGMLCGLANGMLIGMFNVPHFIMTYGMMQIARGFGLMVTRGQSIHGLPAWFRPFGAGRVGVIPIVIFISISILVILAFVMKKTVIGRSFYATGSNPEAAKFSGMRVKRNIFIVYSLSGLLAAFAGVIFVSRMGSAEPIMGEDWPLQAIAASVIGGTTFNGGEGSVVQTFFGAVSVAIIYNILSLTNIPSAWQQFLIGTIVILAILFNRYKWKLVKMR